MALENTVLIHDRRLNDTDNKVKLVLEWKASIEESIEVQKRMIEVGETLIEVLGWVGTMARWLTSIIALFAAMWAAFKGIVYIGRL